MQSLVRQVAVYLVTQSTHAVRMMIGTARTCTIGEIDTRLAICEQCPQFDATASVCRICGCGCNASVNVLANKLALSDESCPDDPPRWVSLR